MKRLQIESCPLSHHQIFHTINHGLLRGFNTYKLHMHVDKTRLLLATLLLTDAITCDNSNRETLRDAFQVLFHDNVVWICLRGGWGGGSVGFKGWTEGAGGQKTLTPQLRRTEKQC